MVKNFIPLYKNVYGAFRVEAKTEGWKKSKAYI